MKRFATLLAGLVAVTGFAAVGPAQAAPYPGTVKTNCHIATRARVPHRAGIYPRVTITSASNLRVRGTFSIAIVHRKRHIGYSGHYRSVAMGRFARGSHQIRVYFTPGKGSPFRGCSAFHRFRSV